jgi:hypothetical protein
MKTTKIYYLVIFTLILGFSLTRCKKDNTTPGTLPSSEVAIAQDNETQDAIADETDQSVDNIVDALEANDFTALKAGTTGAPTYSITTPDTVTFPKTLTLTFNTDTIINGEHITQVGTITITLSLVQNKRPWRNYIKRTISFGNNGLVFSCDSSSVTILGSRTMTRQSVKLTPPITKDNILTLTSLRLDVLDSINSNFTFTITSGTFTKSFTRIVKRTREAIAHFEKLAAVKIWRQALRNDSLIYNGSVTGRNLQDSTYSRIITTPVTFTRCALLVPVVSKGVIALTNGTKTATVTYSASNCKTLVTITRGDKEKVIERKLNRTFRKWW